MNAGKIFLTILVLFLMMFSDIQETIAQSCYELVWSDEFNTPGSPDPTKWTYEIGNNNGNNNESEYYTNRLKNCRIEDTVLIIEAHKEAYGGQQYTSARLNTYGNKLYWKYGKIEARMKLPYGQGIWPAFWMLGKSINNGISWPRCGEIDIMELVGGGEGKDDVIYGTPHWWADANNIHAQYGGSKQLTQGIYADAYHTFSIEWNSSAIRWYMDGKQYHVMSITAADLSEFRDDFFIILNLAVGGTWPGYPNASTVFPQKLYVDYVRVYQLNVTPSIVGDTIVVKAQKNLTFSTIESGDFTYEWIIPEDAQIISGQGTHAIQVNWGCTSGNVICNLSTNCKDYNLQLPVNVANLAILGKEVVKPNELNLKYSVPQSMQATYVWTLPGSVSSTVRLDTNVVFLKWGTKDETITVTVENTCGSENASLDVITLRQLPYPNYKQPHVISGTIESVYYDYGGEGVAYHDAEKANQGTGIRPEEGVDTQANDGGYNVGWTNAGEWLEYTVSVPATKLYDVEIRYASTSTSGKFKISFNGQVRTGVISVPSSGAWNTFKSIYLKNIQLYDTDTLMRVDITTSGFNLGRMIFTESSGTGVQGLESDNNLKIYPTITNGILNIQNLKSKTNFSVVDITGVEVKKGTIEPNSSIDVTSLYTGSYFVILNGHNGKKAYKFIKIQ